MPVKLIPANDLTAFAKQCRLKSGKTKGEVAAALGVRHSSIQLAEDFPEQHLKRLRIRIIEACSDFELEGPLYRVVKRAKRKPPSARDG